MNGAASTPGEALKLYTQCSNCHTVFQLSAEVLRAAGGQVRCGRCGEIFSALARLAENAGAFDTGESAYEMEERADNILESVAVEQVAQATPADSDEEDLDGSEIAQLQVIDFTEEDLIDEAPEETADHDPQSYADASMEFTLPPGELDRIFIESRAGIAPPFSLEYDDAPMSAGTEPGPPSAPTPPIALVPTALTQPIAATLPIAATAPIAITPLTAHAAPAMPASAPTPLFEEEGPLPDIEVIRDNRSPDALRRSSSPVGELDTYDLQERPTRSARLLTLWVGAAVVSALLLVAQVVNRNREALTAHGPLAPVLRLLYSSIGKPLIGSLNLGVFQLRQWGVTGDPAADGTLRVRASILNTSAQLQPFPLLHLTLANRFGTRIGTRDFEASEYMGKPIARSLSPGETVDAILNILDPGKDAEGFEIDVCLRGPGKKIICANDATQAQPKP